MISKNSSTPVNLKTRDADQNNNIESECNNVVAIIEKDIPSAPVRKTKLKKQDTVFQRLNADTVIYEKKKKG